MATTCNSLKRVVRPERFELPTLWFEARCSIQLSYGRVQVEERVYEDGARGATASYGRKTGMPLFTESGSTNAASRFNLFGSPLY